MNKVKPQILVDALVRSFTSAVRGAALDLAERYELRNAFARDFGALRALSPLFAAGWARSRASGIRLFDDAFEFPEIGRKRPDFSIQIDPSALAPLQIGDEEWSAWGAFEPLIPLQQLWRTWAGFAIPTSSPELFTVVVHPPWDIRNHTFDGADYLEWAAGAFTMGTGWCLLQREDQTILYINKYGSERHLIKDTDVEPLLLEAMRTSGTSIEGLMIQKLQSAAKPSVL